jgi:hypothetical protein
MTRVGSQRHKKKIIIICLLFCKLLNDALGVVSNDWMKQNYKLQLYRKKPSWRNLGDYPKIRLEGLRGSAKILSDDRQCTDRDLNGTLSEDIRSVTT